MRPDSKRFLIHRIMCSMMRHTAGTQAEIPVAASHTNASLLVSAMLAAHDSVMLALQPGSQIVI